MEEAGAALEAVGDGVSSKIIWGIGLLAAGQAATMTATFAGQIIMEGFLNIKIAMWKRVAVTRACALGPSLAVALYTADNPGLTNSINEWLNILQVS